MSAGRSGRYLVALPTYNEKGSVAALIAEIVATSPQVDILVIDDSSPDGTAEVVQQLASDDARIRLVQRPGKLGLGSAYVLAFFQALERGYDGVVTMDADRSHDPSVLPLMIEAHGEADLVIGSRFTSGGGTNQPLTRRINSAVANFLARTMLDLSVRDCTSGYRLYGARILRKIPLAELRSRGYSMLVELLCDVVERNGTVVEVPIFFVDRRAGESKIAVHEIWESLRTIARLRRGRFGNLRTKIANWVYNLVTRDPER